MPPTALSPDVTIPALCDQLVVEAWVECTSVGTGGLQALVSQWTPRAELDRFAAFDASRIDGLASEGYFGAVFDGRYIYFSPEHHTENLDTHAVVLRYDTHAPFDEQSSYATYDARSTSGLDTRGFYGAAFDGRYVYFTPRQINFEYYHSRLLRLDTHGDFKDENSWQAFDIGEAQSSQGCAFDGRYLYFCPGFVGDPGKEDEHCGNVIRYDTQSQFDDRDSYQMFDLVSHFGERAACFDGGHFDGRYIYFVPLYSGVVARFDTRQNFEDAASWQVFDATQIGMKLCVGAAYDGRYMYFAPYDSANVVRFDTTKDFEDAASWQAFNAAGTNGLKCGGYDGAHFDGRYVYFVPFTSTRETATGTEYSLHSDYLRYDATREFQDAASWQAFDASRASGIKSVGYNAGAFDGRYFYCAPWRSEPGNTPETAGIHGRVLRLDTLGEGGSFSLRFCDIGHNGGLCASTPGPSFLINTVEGRVFSATSHRALPPGKHHFQGVYDGDKIQLIVNGEVVAQQAASGQIQPCDAPITVGEIEGGLGKFHGVIENVRVSTDAGVLR